MTSANTFKTTFCTSIDRQCRYRTDIGPIESQFAAIDSLIKDKKKSMHHEAMRSQHMSKDNHSRMLLMLIAEADRFHAVNTQKHVCKIERIESSETSSALPAGLSAATKKALVTDVDIVMNDDDKDNYQHALSAVAALSLWH